jgi:hypothetical protein
MARTLCNQGYQTKGNNEIKKTPRKCSEQGSQWHLNKKLPPPKKEKEEKRRKKRKG